MVSILLQMHHYTLTRRDNSRKSTKEIEKIKTEHQAIEINIEGKDETIKSSPKFKAENANQEEWKESLKPHPEDYLEEFPTEITEEEVDNQTKKLTDIIINNATLFFGQTEATKKDSKGWWSKDIKKSRNELKLIKDLKEGKAQLTQKYCKQPK